MFFKINIDNLREPGLGHHFYNLLVLKYCYLHKLILIAPIFTLLNYHNNGKQIETNLSEYYDFSLLTVNNKKQQIMVD